MRTSRIAIFTVLLALSSAEARSAEGGACFTAPEAAGCGNAVLANAQVQQKAAQELLKQSYAANGQLAPADLACYLSATDFVESCVTTHPTCSSHYGFTVQRELAQGWTIEHQLVFTGTAPGHCELSAAASDEFVAYDAPDGSSVLVSSSSHGPAGRMYMVEGSATCHTAAGTETDRRFEMSDNGLLVIDWDEGPVSNHWGRRADPATHGPARVTVVDAATLRFSWPGGAYLDLGVDGKPRGSNFVKASAWDGGACKTGNEGKHVYPILEALPGQSFGRITPGYVKR